MTRSIMTALALPLLVSCTPYNSATSALDTNNKVSVCAADLDSEGVVAKKEPVVYYGRYTLVSILPHADQRDLLDQIIDINIPTNLHPTVGDALQYVLDRSGYSLCVTNTEQLSELFSRPLPSSHYKLGPMTLHNTLQVLAGPSWQLRVIEVKREICFALRQAYPPPQQAASSARHEP